jgi:hypothetical protein
MSDTTRFPVNIELSLDLTVAELTALIPALLAAVPIDSVSHVHFDLAMPAVTAPAPAAA